MPNLDLDAIEARVKKAGENKAQKAIERLSECAEQYAESAKRGGFLLRDEKSIERAMHEEFSWYMWSPDKWDSHVDRFKKLLEVKKRNFSLIARVRELEEENAKLKEKRLSNLESAERMADRVERLTDDNAALRLAATELYGFILEAAPDCGIDPDYGPLGRMAQVLGVKK